MENSAQLLPTSLTPAVLIIDGNNTLLHSNSEAMAIIPSMRKCGHRDGELYLPDEIVSLCDRLKGSQPPVKTVHARLSVEWNCGGSSTDPYGVRAFYINNPAGGEDSRSIMVLMERIVEKRVIDWEKVKDKYALSRREFEVLQLICRGLSNKEIGDKLYICEYTVKDHIKRIMKQMKVRSRNEIMAMFM